MQGSGMRIELLQVAKSKRNEVSLADAPNHLLLVGNKTIVLQVDNLAVASQELEAKGVTFLWREKYLSGSFMYSSMIKDVDGNKINIFQKNTLV